MTRHLARQSAADIDAMLGDQQEHKIRSAIVTAVTSGLVTVRRIGSANDEGDYARLIPGIPKVGNRVALARMGGSELVLGVISRVAETLIDLGAPLVGQSYETGRSTGAASTTNTTNVDPTFADAISLTWSSLPDGTYDFVVAFSMLASHSTAGGVSFRSTVGASNGGGHTITVDTGTTPTLRIENQELYSNVVVAGGVTIKGQYAVGTSGTAYSKNPSLRVTALRKA